MLPGTLRIFYRTALFRVNVLDSKIKNFIPSSYLCTKSKNAEEFKPIYKFPYISIGAALNKIKMVQFFVSGIALPGSVIGSVANLCSTETTIAVSLISIVSTAAVCIVGQVFSNMIGIVYLSPDLQTVRFSYLDFWGTRKNVEFPREELIPLSNSAKYPTDFLYTKVYRYSSTTPNKINLKAGEIINSDAFNYVFKSSPD